MTFKKHDMRPVWRTLLSAALAVVLASGLVPAGAAGGLYARAYAEDGSAAPAASPAADGEGAEDGAMGLVHGSDDADKAIDGAERDAASSPGSADEPPDAPKEASASEGDELATAAESSPAASTEALGPQDALDPTALANGTYKVNVSLVKSDDLSASSMAASAFDGTDTLTVLDGSYVIALELGSVSVGSITGSVMQLAYYPSYTVASNALATSGDYTVAFAAAQTGDHGPANVPVGATAKTNSVGYLALRLWSDAMGGTSQTAALKIDWTTLSKESEAADSTAFDTNVGATVLPESQGEAAASPDADAQPEGSRKFGGIYEKGHVYSVPISFKKENSSETSMAAQYFGSSATVRLNEDDTFDVRFSTNRPDYLLSITRNGSELAVQSETSTSREYSMNLPATTSDTVVPLAMSVKPMIELGSGPVTADMHIAFSQASDLGGDSGQTASSIPKTGDPAGALPPALGLTAAVGALAAAGARRKMKEGE